MAMTKQGVIDAENTPYDPLKAAFDHVIGGPDCSCHRKPSVEQLADHVSQRLADAVKTTVAKGLAGKH